MTNCEELEFGKTLPYEFGDGWMTNNASDLFKILVFVGFPFKKLFNTVNKLQRDRTRKVNAHTVEKAAGIVAQDYEW